MNSLKNILQNADWKQEKHIPVIEVIDHPHKDELLKISVSVGKEIPHPNTTEHHIQWISVYFLPENEKYPYQIGHYDFNAHGESVQGPNTSTVFSHPGIILSFKTSKSGTLLAASYCNIHGLWENALDIKIE